jgi:hypothetical protein
VINFRTGTIALWWLMFSSFVLVLAFHSFYSLFLCFFFFLDYSIPFLHISSFPLIVSLSFFLSFFVITFLMYFYGTHLLIISVSLTCCFLFSPSFPFPAFASALLLFSCYSQATGILYSVYGLSVCLPRIQFR